MRKRPGSHVALSTCSPLFGTCAVCGQGNGRMTHIDGDLNLPIGLCCVEQSINATTALKCAGMARPGADLIARNP